MKGKHGIAFWLILGMWTLTSAFLGGCGSEPGSSDTFVFVMDETGQGEEGHSENQGNAEEGQGSTEEKEGSEIPGGEGSGGMSADQINSEISVILASCAGVTLTETLKNSSGKTIVIDAQIDVDGVSRVSRYRYIPLEFTEDERKAVLKKRFPAEGWDVNEAAVYHEEQNRWEFDTPGGESWVYQVSASEIPGEQVMNLERMDEGLDVSGERILVSIPVDSDSAYGFNDEVMLLMEVIDSIPGEIEQIGQDTIRIAAGMDTYSCRYIFVCEDGGGSRYARAVYQQRADGMPVTAWHDFTTVMTESGGVFPGKYRGSRYTMEEIGLEKTILAPAEAVAAMKEQMDAISMQEEKICITKISLEYLTVISSEGTPEIVPVWRFWPGADEAERCLMFERILAVNAISGEVIWEKRGGI